MKKPALLAALVAVATAAYFLGPKFTSAQAPDFTLYTGGSSQHLTLSKLKGRVVVLDFWASWCGPCRVAIPALERIHQSYRDRGVEVIGINVNDTANPHEVFESLGATYTCLIQGDAVARAYGVRGIPALFVIDRAGNIVMKDSGFGPNTESEIIEAIERALN